jgi:hypothetical protein
MANPNGESIFLLSLYNIEKNKTKGIIQYWKNISRKIL